MIRIDVKNIASQLQLGNVLISRSVGKVVGSIMFEEVTKICAGDFVVVDFTNIDFCDAAFFEESIIALMVHLVRYKENALLYLQNTAPDVLQNIEAALALREQKRKDKIRSRKYDPTIPEDDDVEIHALQRADGTYSVLGVMLEKGLKDTFELVKSRSALTAREVADTFSIELNHASNRLKKLFDSRLILRDQVVDSTGMTYKYYLPA